LNLRIFLGEVFFYSLILVLFFFYLSASPSPPVVGVLLGPLLPPSPPPPHLSPSKRIFAPKARKTTEFADFLRLFSFTAKRYNQET
ncbi:MAG: hypothetical protein AAF849_21775, partial [Bacteroidota bacterium]